MKYLYWLEYINHDLCSRSKIEMINFYRCLRNQFPCMPIVNCVAVACLRYSIIHTSNWFTVCTYILDLLGIFNYCSWAKNKLNQTQKLTHHFCPIRTGKNPLGGKPIISLLVLLLLGVGRRITISKTKYHKCT